MPQITSSLCNAFARLARDTYGKLADSRHVGHQMLEETLTDINILELKRHHSDRIFCQTFSKSQEAINGADWEWWLTDTTRSKWIGFRVQAKVINFRTDTFAHLHYKPKKSRSYQTTRLRNAAEADGLIPLYCLYSDKPPGSHWSSPLFASELYGCSLLRLKDVEQLRRKGKLNDYDQVISLSAPWHVLVCIKSAESSGANSLSLPEAVLSLFFAGYELRSHGFESSEREDAVLSDGSPSIVRRHPPSYVSALVENQPFAELDKPLRGILVIVGDSLNDEKFTR